jgi:hypothetical protein
MVTRPPVEHEDRAARALVEIVNRKPADLDLHQA